MSSRELKCVKCTKVDRSTRNVVFVLVATFRVDGGGLIENCYIGKTLSDLADFRKTVIQLSAAQDNLKASHLLPDVKEKKQLFVGKRDEKNKSTVDDFCQHIVKLPSHLLSDEKVVGFFYNSSAPDEEGAIKLLKDGDSSVGKTTSKGKADAPSVSLLSHSPTSSSPPVVAAAASKPCFEVAYEEVKEITGDSSRLPLAGEYSEVKMSAETPNSRSVFTDVYAECVAPGTNSLQSQSSEVVKMRELPGRPVANEAIYASVFKPKLPPQASGTKPPLSPTGDELYDDTTCFAPVKHEEEPVLYEDATCAAVSFHHHPQQQQQHHKPQTSPRPHGPINASEPDVKQPSSPKKAASSAPSSGPTPLTPIPPMPQFPSPTLLTSETLSNGPLADVSDSGGIQVVAIGDYESGSDNILSFKRGTLATLLLQSDSNWWCIRLGTAHGWVPAAYWRMLNSGDCASLVTKGNSPWFIGKLSRAECEALLMEHGKQQHFVVRESDSGHYALSIKYNERIHHFPIEVTADKKYNIGKHDFKTVNNVILYYQKNALFLDDQGRDVTLGSPLVIIKH